VVFLFEAANVRETVLMKIGVLGSGNVGGTLGSRWAQLGHEVRFAVRDLADPKHGDLLAKSAGNAKLATISEASAFAEVVLLATHWDAAPKVLAAAGSMHGKILIDATNPVTMGPDILRDGLLVGHTTSAAEKVASWATGARVVKAFSTVGWPVMADPTINGVSALLPIAGNDPEAKSAVMKLGEQLGFDARDVGSIEVARLLEPFGMLWIHLAFAMGYGTDFAFQIIRR
jgi:8-hydroxy-5-deazaflavin:NADPH oxidoreductase